MLNAKPKKLRDGSWGALVHNSSVRQGETIQIRAKSGKSWPAKVSKVLWRGKKDGVAIVSTEGKPRRGSRAPNGECRCGACEDLMSLGYMPGERVRCPECGGWAEAS